MNDLKQLLWTVKALHDRSNQIKNEAYSIECQISDKLAEKHGIEEVTIGGWECAESEIDVCYYDPNNDPCLDFCLVCDHPSERK